MSPKLRIKSSRLFKVLVIVLVFSLLVFINPYRVFSPVHSFVSIVTSPFQEVLYSITLKTSAVKESLISIGSLKRENEDLARKNQSLLSQIAILQDTEKENVFLRKQLELLPRDKFELEAAYVIGSDFQNVGNWIEIGKGHNSGIQKDMPVIISNGILIGKIGEVHPRTSQVILVTNPESLINAVGLETESKGVVKGEYGLGIIMDLILQTDVVNVGDKIITSGTGEYIPRGLLIGTVNEIKMSRDGLFQQAIISSPINFSKLQTVFVIKNERF